jgi:hypothetical protein
LTSTTKAVSPAASLAIRAYEGCASTIKDEESCATQRPIISDCEQAPTLMV